MGDFEIELSSDTEDGYDCCGNKIPDPIPLSEVKNLQKNDRVVAQFSATFDRLSLSQSVYSEKDSVDYKILEDFNNHPTVNTKVVLDRIAYPALAIIDFSEGFEKHKIEISEICENVFNSFDKKFVQKKIDQWNVLKDNYQSLNNWQKDLNDLGYDKNLNKNELDKIKNRFMKVAQSLADSLMNNIEQNYFSYENSKIKDLSVIENSYSYFWRNSSKKIFVSLVRDWVIENKLGGEVKF